MIAIALYGAIAMNDLSLPGLQHDEAADADVAIELLTGQPLSSVDNARVLGVELPVMMLHHIGPTTIYTSLAGLALLGISPEALRASQLGVGLIALLLLWQLGRRWFSDVAASLAVLLCASSPTFVWWSRAGANWTIPLLPIALGMMLALTRWWRTRRSTALAWAAFLFGFGVTTKILFVWFLAPLAATAALVLGPRASWRELRRIGLAGTALCAIGLALGLAPLLHHNWPEPHTLDYIASNASRTEVYGHDNRAFLRNLHFLAGDLVHALGGDTLAFGAPMGRPWVGWLYALGVGYLAARVALRRRRLACTTAHPSDDAAANAERTRLLLLLSTIAVLPLGTVSTSHISATYLFVVFPFAFLTVAVTLADGLELARRTQPTTLGRAVAAGIGVVAFGLVAHGVAVNVAILRYFDHSGGQSFWSSANPLLARCLATKYAGREILAMDWGISRSVEFLTAGQTRMSDGFEYRSAPSSDYPARCAAMLERDPIFVFHAPWTTAFHGNREVLATVAATAGKRLVEEEVFCERDGRPNAIVVRTCPRDADCGDLQRCPGSCGPP